MTADKIDGRSHTGRAYNASQITRTESIRFGNKRHTASLEGSRFFSNNCDGLGCIFPSLDGATRQGNKTFILHKNAASLSTDIGVGEGGFTTAAVHNKTRSIVSADRATVQRNCPTAYNSH